MSSKRKIQAAITSLIVLVYSALLVSSWYLAIATGGVPALVLSVLLSVPPSLALIGLLGVIILALVAEFVAQEGKSLTKKKWGD